MAALPRLFVTADKLAKGTLRLAGAEHHYLSRVLRLAVGDKVLLLDGSARVATTRIARVTSEDLELERLSLDSPPPSSAPARAEPEVTLYLGLLKGERHDLVIEKATEIGVRRIVTICCARSVPDLGHDRAERRQQRWQRIVRAAAQQCRRLDLPEVSPPLPLREGLDKFNASATPGCRLMLYEGTAPPLRSLLGDASGQQVGLVIGPEGGLDASEMELLAASGFLPCSLGPRVLRAETAAIAALAVVLSE